MAAVGRGLFFGGTAVKRSPLILAALIALLAVAGSLWLNRLGPAKATLAEKGKDRRPDVIFVPTPQEVVDKMLEVAKVTKNDVVYDLGCGDGRIVCTAAR